MAYVESGVCRLVSRNDHTYKRFDPLCASVAEAVDCQTAVLDGEIVCLDEYGRPQFYDLLFRRAEPYFYAFDVLWLNGEDLRDQPLIKRKKILRGLIGRQPSRLLYADHLAQVGSGLIERICSMDLEGVVAKPADGPYHVFPKRPAWVKIKNPTYSQAEGRQDLFQSR